MGKGTCQFERELPAATLALIDELQTAGYVVHKEWINGIEMRKGKPMREWLLVCQILLVVAMPLLMLPLFVRSIGNNLFGYKHRVLVTIDSADADFFLV
ncbi:MAG: hypothetical protein V4631_00605 [Pseudomonadota bacterium]